MFNHSNSYADLGKTKLWKDFLDGSRVACARLISLVENKPRQLPAIRHLLHTHKNGATRIGITGPPGVGKSTVTAALARMAREGDHRVGIIAVDPSSPFSGGAFLGDRIRMQELVGDEGVFIRSLASREGHGGLSPSTPYVAEVFDAFGMDWIFIETVGVGQSELDVLTCSDIIIVVLQPGTGDMIQALKAGILEAGDIFLINKADLPGAEHLKESLRFTFDLNVSEAPKEPPPIVAVSALENRGLDLMYETLADTIERFDDSGRFIHRRRQRIYDEIVSSVRDALWAQYLAITDSDDIIKQTAKRCADTGESPFPTIQNLITRIKMERNHA